MIDKKFWAVIMVFSVMGIEPCVAIENGSVNHFNSENEIIDKCNDGTENIQIKNFTNTSKIKFINRVNERIPGDLFSYKKHYCSHSSKYHLIKCKENKKSYKKINRSFSDSIETNSVISHKNIEISVDDKNIKDPKNRENKSENDEKKPVHQLEEIKEHYLTNISSNDKSQNCCILNESERNKIGHEDKENYHLKTEIKSNHSLKNENLTNIVDNTNTTEEQDFENSEIDTPTNSNKTQDNNSLNDENRKCIESNSEEPTKDKVTDTLLAVGYAMASVAALCAMNPEPAASKIIAVVAVTIAVLSFVAVICIKWFW